MPSSLLLAYILEFVISGFSQELEMRGYKPPLDDLKKVALVAKSLSALIRDYVKSY